MQREGVKTLHPWLSHVLTRQIPCAALVATMYMSLLWLGIIASQSPFLGIVAMLVAMVLNLMVPAVLGFVALGGGVQFAIKVTWISALMVLLFSQFNVLVTVTFLLLYGMLPLAAVWVLAADSERVGRSAQLLAVGIVLLLLIAMVASSVSQGSSFEVLMSEMMAPFFQSVSVGMTGSDAAELEALKKMTIWLMPGFLAFSLWGIWFSSLLLSYRWAVTYGCIQESEVSFLKLKLSRHVLLLLPLITAVAGVVSGSLQVVLVMLALTLAGMVAVQGVAVAHCWFKARNMGIAIVMMYIVLLLWTMMIVPFVIVGFLDIWFDFRRQTTPINGGK